MLHTLGRLTLTSVSIFILCAGLLACGQSKKETSKPSEASCNESKWSQCIAELSAIDQETQYAKYLSKQIQCKMICDR